MLDKGIFTRRILILDGAMGTMIQRYASGGKIKTDGNNERLNLTCPEIIASIHREYADAGADILETNTFGANRISQLEYGCPELAASMSREGARIAREIANEAARSSGRRILVAGSMGPTGKSLTLAQDPDRPDARTLSFNDFVQAYAEQAEALASGGVDLLLLETCFDALNTKAAIYAIQEATKDIPLIISVSVSDRSGRTLTGQTLEAFYTSVRHAPLLAFGVNCSLGARDLAPLVREIARFSEFPILCYPNAGLPNEMGQYDETPERMAGDMRALARPADFAEGIVNLVGGCCGTTADHIRALAAAVRDIPPRPLPQRRNMLTVCGLETVEIDLESRNFTNVGERTNVAGSRKFARLIAERDYKAALQVAADQIENGASIIDINMDDAMLDSEKEMVTFIRYAQNDPAVARAALMIDSSRWETIRAGLLNAQGKSIVNSISLKEGEGEFLRKAREIHALGAAMVVMAFDEAGQATTLDRKIAICRRAYKLLTEAGIPAEDIIFDCNVLSIGTGIEEHSRYAVDFIEAVRWIKRNLPGTRTSGGISNLSFAFRGNNPVREAMHAVFLYHAVRAGLDMGIVNPGMLQIYDDIEPGLLKAVEDVILDRDRGAAERLIEKARAIVEPRPQPEAYSQTVRSDPRADASVEERLRDALVKGDESHLEADVCECLEKLGKAVEVIEGPLMAGMERVGALFAAGKMFLPQVVKSARVMRAAVAILEPYMETDEAGPATKKPKVILATVKGDVHDIGKNITGIVLTCNGFSVKDLGVMVDKETILAEAEREGADLIAVSGLITPSLFQMEELCAEMAARNMDTPLFVGGATTSDLHTAVKLAPRYRHVFHGGDASASAVMATRCLRDRTAFEAEQHAAQERLRTIYEQRGKSLADERRERRFPDGSYLRKEEYSFSDIPAQTIPAEEVAARFDWKMFLAVWGFKYGAQPSDSKEVMSIQEEGRKVLDRFVEGGAEILLSARFCEGWSEADCLRADGIRLPMLRQEDGDMGSLCDFVPDKSMGFRSPFGMFALCVHQKGTPGNDGYDGMMERAVRVTLAEAASAWLNDWITARIHRPDIRIVKPAAGYASCPDHSLKRDILDLLPDGDRLGIRLTESYAMIPDASICGFIFMHPEASYPEIRNVGREQLERYASMRGMQADEARKLLGNIL